MAGMTKELWAEIPQEERKRRTRNASRAAAVKVIEQLPELDEATRERLRQLLQPVR